MYITSSWQLHCLLVRRWPGQTCLHYPVPGMDCFACLMCMRLQPRGAVTRRICGLAGKAGVALSTLGPGATNMTTSAAYAQLGGFPALLITGAACGVSVAHTCMHGQG